MKKFLIILLTCFLALAIIACENSTEESTTNTESTILQTDPTACAEHVFTESVTAATCIKAGFVQYVCEICNFEYVENIEKLNHNYVSNIIEATCSEKGYEVFTCTLCNNTYKENYTDTVAHTNKISIIDPTCVSAGYTEIKCTICGQFTKSNKTNALGHDYVTKTVNPTGKENGYDIHTCTRCKKSYKDNYTDVVVLYTEVNETVYAISDVNIRKGPSTNFAKIGSLSLGDSVIRIGIGNNDWSKVLYNNEVAYIHSDYLITKEPPVVSVNGYPKIYSDATATITITKEWYKNAWCYIAHIQFTDYSRLFSICANNKLNGYETTSHAARRIGAIFAVNGPYMTDSSYATVKNVKVFRDKSIGSDFGIYNAATGKLSSARSLGIAGKLASAAVADGEVTDTFKFYNSTLVTDGKNVANPNNNDRCQRTFIGTNGKSGDIYIVVSDGRNNDGESAGLRKYQCASLLVELGCKYGVMLDGGGSSTMYFNGKVLNAANGNQRSVVDFLVFK